MAAARERRPLALTALAVHGVMTGVQDQAHGARLNSFDLVTPDGQPVRWALNLLHRAGLADRVYGPTLTLRVLRALRRRGPAGLPVRLDRARRCDGWCRRCRAMFPALKIAGVEPSKFRAARPGEDGEIADRITASGARLVLVGLGCPRQEVFTYAMRPLLDMPLHGRRCGLRLPRRPAAQAAAVDAAVRGLEWLWRLGLEPTRLWRRYVLLNPAYLARLAAQKTGLWKARPRPRQPSDRPPSRSEASTSGRPAGVVVTG